MMGFDLNMKELVEYSKKLAGSVDGFDDFLKGFLIEMANRIIAKTKPRTPKDTGALRGAWFIGDVKHSGKSFYVELKNPMEYATFIEYGHRIVRGGVEVGWYEGRFMLKISIDEVKAQMPLRYRKKFHDWCKMKGIE